MLAALSLFLAGTTVLPPPLTLVVRAHHGAGDRRELTLTAGTSRCVIRLTGDGKYHESVLALPPDADTIHLAETGKGAKQVFPVVDLGALIAPLRMPGPMGPRLRKLMEAKAALEAKHPVLAESHFDLRAATPAKAADVSAAEARLGYALPPEHAELLREIGGAYLDDSSFTEPADLKDAYAQMIQDWGTERRDLEKMLTPKTAALLRESTILYTEVGDGLGGWIYAPKSPVCDGQPAHYWLHQDELNEPSLLTNRDGKCKTYAQALVWLLYQQGLVRYEDAAAALVDRSAPGPLRMDLTLHSGGPSLALRPIWEEAE